MYFSFCWEEGLNCHPSKELSPKQGIVSAIWQFAMEYDDNALKENAVCDWKKAYNIEVKWRIKENEDRTVKSLSEAKMTCPLMVGVYVHM